MSNPNPVTRFVAKDPAEARAVRTQREADRRARLGDKAVRMLAADFRKHGRDAIVRMRERNPVAYLQAVLAVSPTKVSVEHSPHGDWITVLREAQKLAAARSNGTPLPGGATNEKAIEAEIVQVGEE